MHNLYKLEDNLTNEQKWEIVRQYRNSLLESCDFTQLSDVGMSSIEVTSWRFYRQQLRDLPEMFSNPDDIEFPVFVLQEPEVEVDIPYTE